MIIVLDVKAGIQVSLDRAKPDSIREFLEQAEVITSDLYKAETTTVVFKSLLLNCGSAIWCADIDIE